MLLMEEWTCSAAEVEEAEIIKLPCVNFSFNAEADNRVDSRYCINGG